MAETKTCLGCAYLITKRDDNGGVYYCARFEGEVVGLFGRWSVPEMDSTIPLNDDCYEVHGRRKMATYRYRTLIIDDHASFRQYIKELLIERFPTVFIGEAEDGNEALDKVDILRPDLIFMDIKLPGKNGLELTRIIKEKYPRTKIVVITNHDLLEYREAASEYGADYFIPKGSMDEDGIAALVESFLLDRDIETDDTKEKPEILLTSNISPKK